MKDREAWRSSIEIGQFDPQVQTVTWGGKLETRTRVKTEHIDTEEDNRSEISSSVDGENSCVVAKKCVADLAFALLQLAQSVEMKYLKKPLGEFIFFRLQLILKLMQSKH